MRLRWLLSTGHINADEANFIEHGWRHWTKAIAETLIDQCAADIHNMHTKPGYFVTTDFAHQRSKTLVRSDVRST